MPLVTLRRTSLLTIGVLCVGLTVTHVVAESATAAIPDAEVAAEVEEHSLRVVVQNPTLGRVLDERDGYSLVRSLPAPFRDRLHILELHKLSGPHLVQVIELQKPVEHAVLGPDARWCLVSYRGERGVIRIDLINDSQQVLIENAGGLLSLDEKSQRLAVLGFVPSDEPADFNRELTLGVWDLNEEQWIASTRTPIGTMTGVGAISLVLPPVWSGHKVIVEGPDEGILARRISGYRWLTSIDLLTGESETVQGPPNGRGRQWMSPLTATHASEVHEWHRQLEDAWSTRSLPRKGLFPATTVTMSMVELRDGTLVIAMQQDRGAIVTVNISPDGDISIRNIDESRRYRESPHPVGNRLLLARRQQADSGVIHAMYDFVHREVIASSPVSSGFGHSKRSLPSERYLPMGWIEADQTQLRYHSASGDKPCWTIELNGEPTEAQNQFRRRIARAVGSPDGRYVAILAERDNLIEVRQSSDGRVVMMSEPVVDHSYTIAFGPTSNTLAVTSRQMMRLYEIQTGKSIVEAEVPAAYRILALEDGWWCLQDIRALHVLNERLEHQFSLPVKRTLSASWVGENNDRALLLIGELGEITLIDPETAEVRRQHHAVLPAGGPMRREGPLQARIIFEGNVLSRNVGHGATVEFLRLPDFEPLFRFAAVPIDQAEVGWVAWSMDGVWSASPEAEDFVRIVRGIQLSPQENADDHRDPQRIRDIINTVAGRAQ